MNAPGSDPTDVAPPVTAAPPKPRPPLSLRTQLLAWLLLPTAVLVALNSVAAYRNASAAANAAYDRSLLVSARAIADRLVLHGERLSVDLPPSALDLVESDIGARFHYRVGDFAGQAIAGDAGLPPVPANLPRSGAYPALVRFYDARFLDEPVRVAALHQPVNDPAAPPGTAGGVALVQVAETLEARAQLARGILVDTLQRQLSLLLAAAVLMVIAVHVGLRPLRRLQQRLERGEPAEGGTLPAPGTGSGELAAIDPDDVPRELRPFVVAVNGQVDRVAKLVALRKRFLGNAAHQLRTPLAVLKTQVELARREPDPVALRATLDAIGSTTDGAVRLTQQLLSLTRAEHGGDLGERATVDLVALARTTCLDFAPRALRAGIDLGLDAPRTSATVPGHPVLLQELLANLIDNALKYCPAGSRVTVRADASGLAVEDDGPGIAAADRTRVFDRFWRPAGQRVPGSGLGLAIVREIAIAHGGGVHAESGPDGRGMRVVVRFGGAAGTAVDPD